MRSASEENVVARTRAVGQPAAMNESLEPRLEALEKQVAGMREQLAVMKPPEKDWRRSFGIFCQLSSL